MNGDGNGAPYAVDNAVTGEVEALIGVACQR